MLPRIEGTFSFSPQKKRSWKFEIEGGEKRVRVKLSKFSPILFPDPLPITPHLFSFPFVSEFSSPLGWKPQKMKRLLKKCDKSSSEHPVTFHAIPFVLFSPKAHFFQGEVEQGKPKNKQLCPVRYAPNNSCYFSLADLHESCFFSLLLRAPENVCCRSENWEESGFFPPAQKFRDHSGLSVKQ